MKLRRNRFAPTWGIFISQLAIWKCLREDRNNRRRLACVHRIKVRRVAMMSGHTERS